MNFYLFKDAKLVKFSTFEVVSLSELSGESLLKLFDLTAVFGLCMTSVENGPTYMHMYIRYYHICKYTCIRNHKLYIQKGLSICDLTTVYGMTYVENEPMCIYGHI